LLLARIENLNLPSFNISGQATTISRQLKERGFVEEILLFLNSITLIMHSFALLVAAFVSGLDVTSGWQIGENVKIPNGIVIEGHGSAWQPDVSEYLGIPLRDAPSSLRASSALQWNQSD
jgi:hypothetical protein